MSYPYLVKDIQFIASVVFWTSNMMFRVFSLLGIGSCGKAPYNVSLLVLVNTAVAIIYFSGGSCIISVVNSKPVLGGIWRYFSGIYRTLFFFEV